MVGPFGGITAATALNAVMLHPALLGEPLSLTVNFCAALADGPFEASAQPVRTNRSTQHWVVAITQAGAGGESETVVTASVVTAARRTTWSVDDEPMPAVRAPGEEKPYNVPSPVEWLRRYEMRPIEGAIPHTWDGTGSDSGGNIGSDGGGDGDCGGMIGISGGDGGTDGWHWQQWRCQQDDWQQRRRDDWQQRWRDGWHRQFELKRR